MKRLLLAILAAYSRWISPARPRRCKYHPTCSAYATEAITELGAVRGTIVAGWRLLRCNPLSDGGIDDVSDRRLFRGHTHEPTPEHTHGERRPGRPLAPAGEARS